MSRARVYRAPCEPASPTPMPAPVDAAQLLVLQTRVRQERIASGKIKRPEGRTGQTSREYDLRAYKSAFAELGYLRRLAVAGKTGGTVVTSMAQLVQGLARLHPAWTMTGDKFADRDRHHSAVRRRLRDLQAMGLLTWRAGVDVDDEDARTEIELLPAPAVSVDELAAAAAQLARWKKRYGPALNTGSSTGIRNAARHGRPLSASERQRRGVARGRARARRRGARSLTNSAPHFVAPPLAENSHELSTNAEKLRNVSGPRTGARAQHDEANGSCVTRSSVPDALSDRSAISPAKTASLKMGGSNPAGGIAAIDVVALQERVAARQAAREPVWDAIAAQASSRALEVLAWTLERGWPIGRIREAWGVWRHGARCVAEISGARAAGRPEPDDLQRLRRAVARYERHVDARPTGFPDRGLEALAQIAAVAAELDTKPQTLHYGIRQLDQLARRMKASNTTDDSARRDRHAARAHRRHDLDATALPFAFRRSAWPSWVALNAAGAPRLDDDGHLVLAGTVGVAAAPDRDHPWHVQTLRDAQLLAGLWPSEVDGSTVMAREDDSSLVLSDDNAERQRRARPGPYPAPQDRRARPEAADLDFARLSGLSLTEARRVAVHVRDQLLEELRARQFKRRVRERDELWARLHIAAGGEQ